MRALPLIALLSWPIAAHAQKASGTVILKGLKGAPSPVSPLKVTKDERVCGRELPDDSVLVGKDGGLANAVVVAVMDQAALAAQLLAEHEAQGAEPLRLSIDQKGCQFSPRVAAIPIGSTLDLTNSDSLLHNARAMLGTEQAFNFAFPLKNLKREFVAKTVGVLDLHCDAGHTWMRSIVHVLPHRFFAVTDANGRFEIDGLPANATALEVRHERLSAPIVVPLAGKRTGLRIEVPLDVTR